MFDFLKICRPFYAPGRDDGGKPSLDPTPPEPPATPDDTPNTNPKTSLIIYGEADEKEIRAKLEKGGKIQLVSPEGTLDLSTFVLSESWLRIVFKGAYTTYTFDTDTEWDAVEERPEVYVKPASGIPLEDLSADALDSAIEIPEAYATDAGMLVGVKNDGSIGLIDAVYGKANHVYLDEFMADMDADEPIQFFGFDEFTVVDGDVFWLAFDITEVENSADNDDGETDDDGGKSSVGDQEEPPSRDSSEPELPVPEHRLQYYKYTADEERGLNIIPDNWYESPGGFTYDGNIPDGWEFYPNADYGWPDRSNVKVYMRGEIEQIPAEYVQGTLPSMSADDNGTYLAYRDDAWVPVEDIGRLPDASEAASGEYLRVSDGEWIITNGDLPTATTVGKILGVVPGAKDRPPCWAEIDAPADTVIIPFSVDNGTYSMAYEWESVTEPYLLAYDNFGYKNVLGVIIDSDTGDTLAQTANVYLMINGDMAFDFSTTRYDSSSSKIEVETRVISIADDGSVSSNVSSRTVTPDAVE